jgi:iron complex transport system ATP-binding protein
VAPENGLVFVVGPNGAGKTTLVKTIGRLCPISQGEVRLHGRSIDRISPRELAQSVAYVAQFGVPGFSLSVEELLAMSRYPFVGRFSPFGGADVAAVDRAVEVTRVGHLRGRNFRELSGGERQRVLVAAAIAQTPRVLLLDEPGTFLDLTQADELYALLAHLAVEQNILVIAVTHDLNSALVYGDEVFAIKEGTCLFSGSPQLFSDEGMHERLFDRPFRLVRHPGKAIWLTVPGM